VRHLLQLAAFVSLGCTACASVRAPDFSGAAWSGTDGERLSVALRVVPEPLPVGWLFKVPRAAAAGSFSYHKRSGTYDFSESGYFSVDPHWRSEAAYVGVIKPGAVLCVVNPEMQAEVSGDTVTSYRVYDYCVQLRKQ